jgi:uncharacterized protein
MREVVLSAVRQIRQFVNQLRDQLVPPQNGEVTYSYYIRTGDCNQCGQCCSGIALVHNSKPIMTIAEFDVLKKHHDDYRHFIPIEVAEHGVVFRCSHLQPDNSCGIYHDRPSFCRKYPSEDTLLLGGQLAPECSYVFEKKFQFSQLLDQAANKSPESLRRVGKLLNDVKEPTHFSGREAVS